MIRLLLKLLLPLFGAMIAVWTIGIWLYTPPEELRKEDIHLLFRPLRPHVLTVSSMSRQEVLDGSATVSRLWDMRLTVEDAAPPPDRVDGDASPLRKHGGVFTWDFSIPQQRSVSVIMDIQMDEYHMTKWHCYIPLATPGAWARLEPSDASELERLRIIDTEFMSRTDRVFVFFLGGIAFLIALGFGSYVMLRLKSIRKVLGRIRDGDLAARVGGTGHDLIHQLGHDCDAMATHLQQLITQQDTMLRMLAHELRTPLARMDMGIHLAEREAGGSPRLTAVRQEIEHLERLIQDLTRLIRIEHQVATEPTTPIQIAQVVDDAITGMRASHPHLTWTRAGTTDLSLPGHPALVRIAMLNLLSNAARFAQKQVAVGLTGHLDHVELWVDDDGIGIPESERERIFMPFFTLGASGKNGTGLGLAIVQRILTAAGGTARCAAAPLGGARFTLSWPLRPTPSGINPHTPD